MKPRMLFILWLFATGFALGEQSSAQSDEGNAPQKAACTVRREELEVFAAYLKRETSPQVVVTRTEPARPDVDTLSLQLAATGRGIPADVRADFKAKNKSGCAINPFAGISNLHFISREEHDLMFRGGWREFHKRYGKDAELLWLSRVGFNSDRTLALLHVSGGIDRMASGGELYLFERKEGKWVIKLQVQTWAT